MTEARESMRQPSYTSVSVDYSHQGKTATIIIRRLEVHNALKSQLIEELTAAFTDLSEIEGQEGLRAFLEKRTPSWIVPSANGGQ